MQFDVRTGETYSSHGVPVEVDGVCMVKVDPTDEGIELAAEQFLAGGRDDIARTAQQAVEGHLRAAVGGHSIEDVYRERAKLVEATKDLAGPDLSKMGLEIVSLTIRAIQDKQGYLEALGRPRTAQVKRDAVRGEAEAEREAKAARFEADASIESSRRDYEIEKSSFKEEGQKAAAQADLAYDLQRAIVQQEVRAQELQVEIVERQKAIELMEAEVTARVHELEAEVIEPAKSEARRDRGARRGAQGGARRPGRRRGGRRAPARDGRGRDDDGEGQRLGRVQRGRDRRPAGARVLPELAAAVSEPLAKTEKIVMLGGNGDGVGAHRITRDVTKIVAELPEVLESLTGKRLDELVQALPKAGGNGDGDRGQRCR